MVQFFIYIRQGIPVDLIKDFADYKDDIYNHCQEIVNEENGAFTPNPLSSGKDIAGDKGVHREVESKGSWMLGTY